MATTEIHPIHTTLKRALDYYMNPQKTDNGNLVTGINCVPQISYEQFMLTKDYFNKKDKILALSIRQAFKPGEVTKEIAHEIGVNTARHFLGNDKFEILVCTHIDKDHIHNHITFNSVSFTSGEKFNESFSAMKLRSISDRLCRDYGLSVIDNPKEKGKSYKEWMEDKRGMSWKSQIRNDIDRILSYVEDFDDFISRMKKAGYAIKRGKYISYRPPGGERYARGKTLGVGYTDDSIKAKIIISKLGGQFLFEREGDKLRNRNSRYRSNSKNLFSRKSSISSLLATNFRLCITIIKALSGRLQSPAYKNIKKPQLNEQETRAVETRIKMLVDQLFVIRNEKIKGKCDLRQKLVLSEKLLQDSRAGLKKSEISLKDMESTHDAIDTIRKYEPVIRQVNNSIQRKKVAAKYESEIRLYDFAKTHLSNVGIKTESDITSFLLSYQDQKRIHELFKRDYGIAKVKVSALRELQDATNDLFEIKYALRKEEASQPISGKETHNKKGR